MNCSLPGSSIHGIFQARILDWVAISFSRGSSRPRYRTQVSGTAGRLFTIWATREATQKISGQHTIYPAQKLGAPRATSSGDLQVSSPDGEAMLAWGYNLPLTPKTLSLLDSFQTLGKCREKASEQKLEDSAEQPWGWQASADRFRTGPAWDTMGSELP